MIMHKSTRILDWYACNNFHARYVQIRLDYSQLKIEVSGVLVKKLLTIMTLLTNKMMKLNLIIFRFEFGISIPSVPIENLITIMYSHIIDKSDDEIRLDYSQV